MEVLTSNNGELQLFKWTVTTAVAGSCSTVVFDPPPRNGRPPPAISSLVFTFLRDVAAAWRSGFVNLRWKLTEVSLPFTASVRGVEGSLFFAMAVELGDEHDGNVTKQSTRRWRKSSVEVSGSEQASISLSASSHSRFLNDGSKAAASPSSR
nr:hypothetical protein Iba_chr12cCG13370 [Ipomoea batatas]